MKHDEKKQTSNTTAKVYTVGKKKTPENDQRTRLRKHMMAGGAPKFFSLEEGMCSSNAAKMLKNMGIRKVFITDEEHEHLMERRKGGAA